MALGHADFSELVATTLRKVEPELWDNVTTKHPLLDLISSKEQSQTGRALVINLELAEDTSTQWTDESGTFSSTKSGEVVGSAVFEWSDPLVSSVRIPWKKLKMNQGKEQVIDLLKTHINSMLKAHRKEIVQTFHYRVSNGLPAEAKFLSLDQIVSDAAYDANPTGAAAGSETPFTVGGIDASVQTVWQGNRIELPLDGGTSIRKAFRTVANEVYVATDSNNEIDALVCGRDVFEEFEDSFDGNVRYTEFGEGQSKFTEIKFGDLKVRLDPDAPSRRVYALDTDTWKFKSLAGAFMEAQEPQKVANTLDKVHPVASVLSVGVTERRGNAVLLRPTTAGGDA